MPSSSGLGQVATFLILGVTLSAATLAHTGPAAGAASITATIASAGNPANAVLGWHSETNPSAVGRPSPATSEAVALIEIVETGLPVNTTWSFWVWSCTPTSCGGESGATNRSYEIVGQAPVVGTAQWGVSEVPGYVPYPASGVFTPSNVSVTVSVSYLALGAHECSIAVAETGLPLGATWWAQVAGFNYFSSGTLLYGLAPCYSFASVWFGSVSDWQPTPANVTLFVPVGESLVTAVVFLAPPAQPPDVLAFVALGGGLMVAITAAAGHLLGRRDRGSAGPPAR